MTDMTPNIPEVVAEVRARFEAYEAALETKDVEVLDATFWESPHTIRYALHENGYGFAEIHAHRVARQPGPGIKEERRGLEILTLGRDYAVVNLEFKVRGATSSGGRARPGPASPISAGRSWPRMCPRSAKRPSGRRGPAASERPVQQGFSVPIPPQVLQPDFRATRSCIERAAPRDPLCGVMNRVRQCPRGCSRRANWLDGHHIQERRLAIPPQGKRSVVRSASTSYQRLAANPTLTSTAVSFTDALDQRFRAGMLVVDDHAVVGVDPAERR